MGREDLQFTQARDDVRSYAGLMVQVITLLLSTVFIVVGWAAKDFMQSKYETAERYVLPLNDSGEPVVRTTADADPDVPESDPNSVMQIKKEQRNSERLIGERFREAVWESPTTTAFLLTSWFFLSVVSGMLILISHMIDRRRYEFHRGKLLVRTDPSQAYGDEIVTIQPLWELGLLIWYASLSCGILSTCQLYRYTTNHFGNLVLVLALVYLGCVLKFILLTRLAFRASVLREAYVKEMRAIYLMSLVEKAISKILPMKQAEGWDENDNRARFVKLLLTARDALMGGHRNYMSAVVAIDFVSANVEGTPLRLTIESEIDEFDRIKTLGVTTFLVKPVRVLHGLIRKLSRSAAPKHYYCRNCWCIVPVPLGNSAGGQCPKCGEVVIVRRCSWCL